LSYEYEAIVIYNNKNNVISCNPEVCNLKFTKGLDKIKTVTRNSAPVSDSIYAVLNLPKDLRTDGLIIKLNLREPKDDEMPSCYNFEMPVFLASPIVFVTGVEKK
jgi:hypothetical protein